MKGLKYLFVGIVFGIIMVKSEAVSWYRIQEMFRFQSFHMYGIIGTAVIFGAVIVQLIKMFKIRAYKGDVIIVEEKNKQYKRNIMGGIIFGLGWALTGACPGPMFVLLGYGYSVFIVILLSAVLGAWVQGLVVIKL